MCYLVRYHLTTNYYSVYHFEKLRAHINYGTYKMYRGGIIAQNKLDIHTKTVDSMGFDYYLYRNTFPGMQGKFIIYHLSYRASILRS